MPGWWEDISEAREFDDLPAKARDYVLRLEELAGAHISCIGVGPGREQTIVRRDILAPLVTDPRLVDPDYDKHGGFPNFEAAQPGPGFGRFLTAMRRTQDLAVSADPDTDTWNEAADLRGEVGEAARPVRGARGRRPGQQGAVPARFGQPADAALSGDDV